MPPRKSKRKHSVRPKARRATKFPQPLRVGLAFDRLVAVMNRLRAPDGCPWDREQTHATLRTYLIEEAYEVLDAIDSADDAKFAEELGDLLLQVLFHAQMAHEESRFSIADVIREIYEKMIRRHPHVFGEKRAKDAAEVLRNWEIIKREERMRKEVKEAEEVKEVKNKAGSARGSASSTSSTSPTSSTSILDGVPRTLPALLEALQLTRKAARIGFDWDSVDGIFAKLEEETRELRHALSQPVAQGESSSPAVSSDVVAAGLQTRAVASPSASPVAPASSRPSSAIELELGDMLFAVVNLARFLHIDPEIALKKASAKFSRRFYEMERLARSQGTSLAEVPRPQMESLWDRAKLEERREP